MDEKILKELAEITDRKEAFLRKLTNASTLSGISNIEESITDSDLVKLTKELLQSGISKIKDQIVDADSDKKQIQEETILYSKFIKNEFLDTLWHPFEALLNQIIENTQIKKNKSFETPDRLPSQILFFKLQSLCLSLTELWYGKGKGNLSRLYIAFHAILEAAEISVYPLPKIQGPKTKEGYETIDFKKRIQYFDYFRNVLKRKYYEQGGKDYGHSPIDDLNLPTVYTKQEGKRFLITAHCKKALVKFFQIKQKGLQNWGQLSEEIQKKGYDFIQDQIQRVLYLPQKNKENEEHYKIYCDFISKNPGQFFQNNRLLHLTILYLGLWQKALCLIKRKTLDAFLHQRYLAYPWKRQLPLMKMSDTTPHGTPLFKLQRKAKTAEWSRIRVNNLGYGEAHCLSLTSSGLWEGEAQSSNFHYDWNTPQDETAFLPNYNLFDIEKMARDTFILNPKSDSSKLLPGECFISVGQNPNTCASIPNTQHLQVMRSSLVNYLLFQKNSDPQQIEPLQLTYDFIQVGQKEDAFFLKLITPLVLNSDLNYPLLNHIMNLQNSLQAHFGGGKSIDFLTHFIPDGQKNVIILFVPFSYFKVLKHNQTERLFNPETRQFFKGTLGCRFGVYSASGNQPIPAQGEGNYRIEDFYDFIAKKGTKAFTKNYIQKHFIDETIHKKFKYT